MRTRTNWGCVGAGAVIALLLFAGVVLWSTAGTTLVRAATSWVGNARVIPTATDAVVITGPKGAAEATPTPELDEVPGQPTAESEVASAAGTTRDLPTAPAGADFWALGVERVDDTEWWRLKEATNRSYCAWSFQFQFEASNGVSAQWPHCVELRIAGTGTVKFTVRPDDGYSTSDTQGTGLAWWPSGNSGEYRVDDGEWIPLTTGPEGVTFPINSGPRVIEIRLTNGYAGIPLGEIRNNVQPQY